MQNAKDSFYVALRNRLAIVNPQRTILIRGTVRPGVVVEEAESPMQSAPNDIFVLRWLGLGMETNLPDSMVAEECEVSYQTTGTQTYGGLDRGRALAAMDEELLVLLQPPTTPKYDYSGTNPVQLLTQVFWEEPVFGALTTQRDLLSRAAKVMVYSYQEQGE